MCPASFERTGTAPASPVCPADRARAARSRLRLSPIAALVLAGAATTAGRADTLHLVDGRTIPAERCRLEGAEWRCRRAGGEIGFPASRVIRVETSPLPASPLPPAAPSAPSPGAHAAPQAPPGPAPDRGLQVVVSPRIAQSLALGELALQSQDYPAAEERFREALLKEPGSPVARLKLAMVLIVTDRYGEAESLLREVLAADSRDARATDLLGEVAFQTGRIDDAIATWERALTLQPDPAIHERLLRARRLQSAEQGFRQSDGAHFALKYDGGEATGDLAREILEHLDATWSRLAGRLAHYPDGVIQVTLYSTRAFHEATESPDWVGGLFDGQIRVPIRGLTRLTPQAQRVLTHELTHAFLASASRGNAPKWLQEGFAQVMEGRTARGDRMALRQAWTILDGVSWAREFTYPKALSQVEYLLETWSDAHLHEILRRLGRGESIDAALNQSLGQDSAAFFASWGEWLAR